MPAVRLTSVASAAASPHARAGRAARRSPRLTSTDLRAACRRASWWDRGASAPGAANGPLSAAGSSWAAEPLPLKCLVLQKQKPVLDEAWSYFLAQQRIPLETVYH